ncbi:putative spermidine/putrescine transport system permease protein [Bosea sp. 62]|uniref:ABC transporter permease n=1 Tax=unclassified Bosea (in: a-proteobacteria) TaxID=2653178 RepID=UPI00125231AA|nr:MULTISPECIES: ABC transporter permease [unclassified Bosea (in: a-proteobacteria)]CAD5250280.1 putative spermidine/putrescine transport system permease protein [Bosea sp. 7B]CAD5282244.1 putative spermidine/putrescine transport system permease protein [Bosea sp. 21B]CAD5283893.1 putative spermidine/putrescine transport system permease protein [Bosea sp. 46]VVT52557.1 putative spermidine/putrescine transport system permease protein [Bosea sp. EC-HK365B]VXB21440.1 putative spermidine/putresci
MSGRLSPVLLLCALPAAFFVAFFLAPMAVVLIASLTTAAGQPTFAHYVRILADAYHWDVLWVTFRIGALTTLVCVLIGYPLAWYLVRIVKWRPWRRFCVILLVVPLFTSNIVRSFGWMVLLGRNGLVNDGLIGLGLIERPMRFLGTELGILIGLVYILLPFIVLAVGNALAKVDPALEHASADLGATPAGTFRTIIFPLSLPGLMAGAVMVFMLAVSAYVTPALLSGGRITVFSMLIFQQYSSVFDFNYGGALSITMLVLTLALVAIAGRLSEPRRA